MPWVILLLSAVLEAVWAIALGASDGFTRLGPVVVFGIALVLSMIGLGYATKTIPMSTAYAVWTGTGAALAVTWGMATGIEPVTALRIAFVFGIIISVVGLKLVKAPKTQPDDAPAVVVPAGDRTQ